MPSDATTFKPEDNEQFRGKAYFESWLKMKYAIEGPEAMRAAIKDKINGVALMAGLLISFALPLTFTDFSAFIDTSERRAAQSIFVITMGLGSVFLLCSVLSSVFVLDMVCVVMNTKGDLAWWALNRAPTVNVPQNFLFVGAVLIIIAFCTGSYLVLDGRWEAWILICATVLSTVALLVWQQLTMSKIFVVHGLNGFTKHEVNHFEEVETSALPTD